MFFSPNTATSTNSDPSISDRAFKMAAAAASLGANPFLGLPPAALQAFSLLGNSPANHQPPPVTQSPLTPPHPPLPFQGVMEQLSSTQALLNLAAARSAAASSSSSSPSSPPSTTTTTKRKQAGDSPLDLSGSPGATPSPPPTPNHNKRPRLSSGDEPLSAEASALLKWSVDEVSRFVEQVEMCGDYAKVNGLNIVSILT